MRKTSKQTKPRIAFITGEKEKEILTYFKTQKDNRTSVVAEHFGVSNHQVNRILDIHFDRTKTNESHKSKK